LRSTEGSPDGTREDGRSRRRMAVLKAVVDRYVETGEPVSSRALKAAGGWDISSATIRAIMAELEEGGLLTHPHTSAGRIPSAVGFRRYVELVLDEHRAGRGAEAAVAVLAPEMAGMPALLSQAARALSSLSSYVGVALRPGLDQILLRSAQFVGLEGDRVVVIVVGERGVVSNRVVQVEESYPQEELDRIARYIVNRFQGRSLADVRKVVTSELARDRQARDVAVGRLLDLALSTIGSGSEEGAVLVDGAADCLQRPQFVDVEAAQQLLRAYEEKGRIGRLLESCLEREGVQVQIGGPDEHADERELAGLPDLAFVASPYGDGERTLGSVGVLGPTRMSYEHVIRMVAQAAEEISSALGNQPVDRRS